ncbi:Protein of unknown function, putative, partial [Plasmodium vivax]
FPKSLENEFRHDKMLNLIFSRLLAKHDLHRELQHRDLKDTLSGDRMNNKGRNMLGDISTYSGIKRKESNNLDDYMKKYKRRYGKKKGLSKLDCYCEKKVFGKFKHMCDIAEKMHNDKKRWKSFFFKKYGIGLIIFALLPTIGLIFPILFGLGNGKQGILEQCPSEHFNNQKKHLTGGQYDNCTTKWILDYNDTINILEYVSYIYMFTMCFIVILFIIYFLIKVIKYEKIKAGKGKMNMKEYCRFCKDIF